jgi:hypothetical protein
LRYLLSSPYYQLLSGLCAILRVASDHQVIEVRISLSNQKASPGMSFLKLIFTIESANLSLMEGDCQYLVEKFIYDRRRWSSRSGLGVDWESRPFEVVEEKSKNSIRTLD